MEKTVPTRRPDAPLDTDLLACYVMLDDGRLLSFPEDHPLISGGICNRTTVLQDPRMTRQQAVRDLRQLADALDRHEDFFVANPEDGSVCEVSAPTDCTSK